jgi:hypothetical protein
MFIRSNSLAAPLLGVVVLVVFVAAQVAAAPCTAPDNGSGTVTLPAPCPYVTPDYGPMLIIEGLPPGATLVMEATLTGFSCEHGGGMCSLPLAQGQCETAGGTLGGHGHCFEASLQLAVSGTGSLAGFNRNLSVPVEVEVHTGPRNPGDPVQIIPAEIYRMQGILYGDPDFCAFEIHAGVDFGLPSPGQFTLTELPSGDFAVESFFDITYLVDFAGCPGSVLDDYSGSTTATTRIIQGEVAPETWMPGDDHKMHFPQLPDTVGWDVNATFPAILADDWLCSESGWVKDIHFWGSWLHGHDELIRSFRISIYEDVPAGVDSPYSHPGELLWEHVISNFMVTEINPGQWEGWYDPGPGIFLAEDHAQFFQYDVYLDSLLWFLQEEGTIYWLSITANVVSAVEALWGWKSSVHHWQDNAVWSMIGEPCIGPDNGSGTVTLPADCPYHTLEEPMEIVDGLPPGTTIEMDAVLTNFTCVHDGGLCTLPLAQTQCEMAGGTLGGHGHCFEASLQLAVAGTGSLAGFNRNLSVPVEVEIHTAPRNPGDPVQTFIATIYRLSGVLYGDPDFCEFVVLAGTDYGLPSPGQFTLTELPSGDFAVESFFDVTYQISFAGCPASIIEGYAGTTTGTVRWQQGEPLIDVWRELYEPPQFGRPLDLSFVITGSCCVGITGNVDGDNAETIDIGDLTALISYLYIPPNPEPPCMEEADIDGAPGNLVDIGDLTALISYLYIPPNPPPADCPQ